MRRVVVTGMGGVTALGNDWSTIRRRMEKGETGIRYMQDWERYHGVRTRLAGPVPDFDVSQRYPRKKLRSMGRIAQMAVLASENALGQAGLLEDPWLSSGRVGVAYGSSFGSKLPVLNFANLIHTGSAENLTATSYIRMMSHTTAVNIGLFFGLQGRIVPTSSACTSGSQGIGYAYETIKYGMQDAMVAGGAEELCITDVAVFDTLFATSTRNEAPETSPRPFDRDRDGLVIGEGAGALVLEALDHARARGATILAEIVGFATNSDGQHVTQPAAATMETALRSALSVADLPPEAVGAVNGHGTATDRGDLAESQATHAVFGPGMPILSLKSYYGHTLGACGAVEAWLGIEMMKDRWFPPTINLKNVDPDCAELDYIMGSPREIDLDCFMSNNFAFGGINTSLIFKRYLQ